MKQKDKEKKKKPYTKPAIKKFEQLHKIVLGT